MWEKIEKNGGGKKEKKILQFKNTQEKRPGKVEPCPNGKGEDNLLTSDTRREKESKGTKRGGLKDT